MATVRPFPALRPGPERAADVAAVPYDVVSTAEARELASGNPWSFLHVSRAEIDLPDAADPYSDAVYRKAADNFARLEREAPMLVEEGRHLYVYRMRMGDHVQTGIAGVCSLAEYEAGIVRKHERTRRDKEDDRTRHMIALRAQTGPVFLTYRDVAEIDSRVERATREAPLYDFTAPDRIRHTLWRLTRDESDAIEQAFTRVPLLYIADGHHRAASAARAREELRRTAPADPGSDPFDFFLAVAFPARQVRILAYNRIVKDLGGRPPEKFLEDARRRFEIFDGAAAEPTRKGEVSFYLVGKWYGLRLRARKIVRSAGPTATLDAHLLQEEVLEPLLGIRDIRTDKRIDFVGGIRGTAELQRLVDSGQAAVAFSLHPVAIEELMAVADANEIMPPKSTWFEPKLRDGLLIHEI
jgi:uncharacterized protein (DUF1015 family)